MAINYITALKVHKALFSSLNNQAQESLSSIRMIKSFGLEQQQHVRFETVAKRDGSMTTKYASGKSQALFVDFMAIGFAIACCGGRRLFCSQWHIDIGRINQFCNVFRANDLAMLQH